jgi:hypothetical protein
MYTHKTQNLFGYVLAMCVMVPMAAWVVPLVQQIAG